MLRLQPSFDGSVEASHPHVKDHNAHCRALPFRQQGRMTYPHERDDEISHGRNPPRTGCRHRGRVQIDTPIRSCAVAGSRCRMPRPGGCAPPHDRATRDPSWLHRHPRTPPRRCRARRSRVARAPRTTNLRGDRDDRLLSKPGGRPHTLRGQAGRTAEADPRHVVLLAGRGRHRALRRSRPSRRAGGTAGHVRRIRLRGVPRATGHLRHDVG